jgi:hypothetical protein
MSDRDTLEEGGVSGRERACRISLDHNPVWPVGLQDGLETLQNGCRDVRQRLTLGHDFQINIRHDPEKPVHLVEHLAMLAGYAGYTTDAIPSG